MRSGNVVDASTPCVDADRNHQRIYFHRILQSLIRGSA